MPAPQQHQNLLTVRELTQVDGTQALLASWPPRSAALDRLARAVASTSAAAVVKEGEGKVRLGESGVAVNKLGIVMASPAATRGGPPPRKPRRPRTPVWPAHQRRPARRGVL